MLCADRPQSFVTSPASFQALLAFPPSWSAAAKRIEDELEDDDSSGSDGFDSAGSDANEEVAGLARHGSAAATRGAASGRAAGTAGTAAPRRTARSPRSSSQAVHFDCPSLAWSMTQDDGTQFVDVTVRQLRFGLAKNECGMRSGCLLHSVQAEGEEDSQSATSLGIPWRASCF